MIDFSRLRTSHYIAIFFWAHIGMLAIFEEVFYQSWVYDNAYQFGSAVFATILMLGWFLADSKENGVETPRVMKVMVVAFAPIAITYYRFKYFGMRRGFIFLGVVVAALAATILVTQGVLELFVYED